MKTDNIRHLHIDITITLNYDAGYQFTEPYASENIDINVPLDVVDKKNLYNVLHELIVAKIDALPAKFNVKKVEQELKSIG